MSAYQQLMDGFTSEYYRLQEEGHKAALQTMKDNALETKRKRKGKKFTYRIKKRSKKQ